MKIGIRDLKNMASDSEIEKTSGRGTSGWGEGRPGRDFLQGTQCPPPPQLPFVQFLRSHVDTTVVKTLMKERLRKPA